MRRFLQTAQLPILLLVATPTGAEEILYLTNGRQIRVEHFWEEGEQIFYEIKGNVFGFPRTLLERVDHVGSASDDEEVQQPESGFRNEIATDTVQAARDEARKGDLDEAGRLYRSALRKAPDSIVARVELAELYIQRGDLRAAQSQLEQAKRLVPEDPDVRERLGDVYYDRGRTSLAIREWQLALSQQPNPALLYKLKQALRENDDDINFEEIEQPHFLIRYDGRVNESIGRIVAAALDEEYYELSRELHFTPGAPIHVTLYTNQEFQDVTRAPKWASALNDGEIRVPVEGVTVMTPKLQRVLRHELTHSFINALTQGNCPAWFHEGIAQLREGKEGMDPYPRLREAQARGALLPLWSLEGPLLNYSKEKALLVYAQSLSATQYVTARKGRSALVKILGMLAQRQTMNDALKKVVGLDYQEFQVAWEADLTRYRPTSR
jgi:Tfp pilus assembly protein PilF